jgi:hypothetical protein
MNNTLITTQLGEQVIGRIVALHCEKKLTHGDLVQIIEACAEQLTLMSRSQYSTMFGKSYNGAKNHRMNITLLGKPWVIDPH